MPPSPPPAGLAKKPEWSPRIWEGLHFFAWMRLLFRNRFAVHWSRWYIAAIITASSISHTLMSWIQEAIHGRRIRTTTLKGSPIFILGHWRSGTTLLHEFMVQDERFGFPTTYECFDPNHFLLTERLFTWMMRFLLPSSRPMDNMKVGFDRPQEDEFALCLLGQPSPYLTIAFPNHPPQYQEYLDLESVPSGLLRSWKRTLTQFLKHVTLKSGKRLVLKSPPHTARVKVLKEMFPDALFIHIVRDPYVVFSSTVNLWKTLYLTHGLQRPNFDGLEEQVYATFLKMYERLEEAKKTLDPGRFYELKYEELIKDPAAAMRQIYDHLKLGDFDRYLPRLEAYLATIKGYETNRYQLSDEKREEISKRWAPVIERYGYTRW